MTCAMSWPRAENLVHHVERRAQLFFTDGERRRDAQRLAAGGRELMEDGQPTERFKDIVPFIEAAAERRLGEHFGIGLYLRHVFEDFGDSQAWGISLSWNH